AIVLIVGCKAVAFELHCPCCVRTQPQAPAQIFIERRDVPITQTVSLAVTMKPRSVCVAIREKLKQTSCSCDPKCVVRSFEELEHPRSRHALADRIRGSYHWRLMSLIRHKTEEAAVAGPRPQLSLVIF